MLPTCPRSICAALPSVFCGLLGARRHSRGRAACSVAGLGGTAARGHLTAFHAAHQVNVLRAARVAGEAACMEDGLDAFVDAACAPLLEEWGLSLPPLLHGAGLQGGSLVLRDGGDFADDSPGDGALALAPARSGSGSAAPPGSAAAEEARPGWRCLQPQHPANCIRCGSGRRRVPLSQAPAATLTAARAAPAQLHATSTGGPGGQLDARGRQNMQERCVCGRRSAARSRAAARNIVWVRVHCR